MAGPVARTVMDDQTQLRTMIDFARRHLASNAAEAEAFAPGDQSGQMRHRLAGLKKTIELLLEAAEPLAAPPRSNTPRPDGTAE
ncbi:hypothetical protein [Streptomyces ochraceiscleroticus]|uniref:Uncharacterized protein n=1 Tax=Streptomyces ochraceiscleroticus TaxID=47761 RepID=A0ABW1MIJ9_9ACTN|nr:hypothetical protein [Streptomyces ochraceiscleroticus]